MYAGATKLGYKEVHTGNMAINSVPRDDRARCMQIGFCFQGCKSGAKWSTLYTELPKAEKTGNLDLRPESHVTRIEHDDKGKVTGVVYFDKDGKEQRQKARIVCVAGNSIETPRLLLLSASDMFKDGLANSSGQVGRNYMRHMTGIGLRHVQASRCTCTAARRWPASCATRPRTTPSAASSAATSWRRCRWACRSWPRS